MKGTPSFKTLPTVESAESCIVRLPGTSTSCASARKSGARVRSKPENKSIPSLQVLILIVDSLPELRARRVEFACSCGIALPAEGRSSLRARRLSSKRRRAEQERAEPDQVGQSKKEGDRRGEAAEHPLTSSGTGKTNRL